MATNVLFLVHGVGEQKTGWSQDAQDLLAEELSKYPTFRNANSPLSNHLTFEEITYNDVFDDILKGWKDLTEQFDAVSDENMPGTLRSINRFIGRMADNGSQVRNNQRAKRAADVLLYRGLILVQRLVLLKVVSRIATVIAQKLGEPGGHLARFGVLGHSLGTAVVHDALQVMSTTRWLRENNGSLRTFKNVSNDEIRAADAALGATPLGTGNFRFQSIYMVSNTSPLLSVTTSPYRSVVRPPVGRNIKGNTNKYVNINHRFDPVGMVRPMDLSKWPGASARKTAVDLKPRHIHQLNVHDLAHYLADPQVHGHIFLDLVRPFTRDDYGYALRRKDPQTNLTDHAFPKYKGQFTQENARARLESRIKEEVLKKLMAGLQIVDRKIPEAGGQ